MSVSTCAVHVHTVHGLMGCAHRHPHQLPLAGLEEELGPLHSHIPPSLQYSKPSKTSAQPSLWKNSWLPLQVCSILLRVGSSLSTAWEKLTVIIAGKEFSKDTEGKSTIHISQLLPFELFFNFGRKDGGMSVEPLDIGTKDLQTKERLQVLQ